MSIRIKTNIIAQTVHKNLRKTSEKRFEQLEKLSSGKRINRAKDDTAGLSVAAKMDAQVRGLKMALKMPTMEFLSFKQQRVDFMR